MNMGWEIFYQFVFGCLFAAGLVSVVILVKTLVNFSRTGPAIKEEVLKSYRLYSVFAIARLFIWCILINFYLAAAGNLIYFSLTVLRGTGFTELLIFISALLAIIFFTTLQFLKHLLLIPSNIALSSHYSMKNFYKIWHYLSPLKLQIFDYAFKLIYLLLVCSAVYRLNKNDFVIEAQILLLILLIQLVIFIWSTYSVPDFIQGILDKKAVNNMSKPNIIMIGSDTLRVDRLGRIRKGQSITPNIDKLIKKSIYFEHCYVPIARTAPSLISLFSGVLPWKHHIRDNFVEYDEIKLDVTPFPKILEQQGYSTAVISDWCGTDFGKFDLGFEMQDLPEDQWNIRYYIRQGPKDMRLFLSLFIKNHLGKTFLPEIFYLGGVPQGRYLLNKTKQWLRKLSKNDKPFLLNTFFSTTHPPFGTEYPYYSMYADPDYWGESKFAMSRLSDPVDIIKSQKEPKEAFDLDQIIDLYDGSVTNFDDQVGEILNYLKENDLEKNSIVVIYSDHGMEFFENDTWGQGNSVLSEHSNKIPLIIYDPSREQGQTNSSRIRTVDLVPTLLDMIFNDYCDESDEKYDGISLKNIIANNEKIDLDVIAETGIWFTKPPGMIKDHMSYPDLLDIITINDKQLGTIVLKPELKNKIYQAKDCVLISGQWKLIRFSLKDDYKYQLFDRDNDPDCHNDVLHMNNDIFLKLKEKMNSLHCSYN